MRWSPDRSKVRSEPPTVSKASVPPARVTGPVPSAVGRKRLTATVPALTVRPPEKLLAGLRRARVPAPVLVRPKAPVTAPPTARVELATLRTRLPVRVTPPWPRLRERVPVKVTSPPRVTALRWALTKPAGPALSRTRAPVMASGPVPRAWELLISSTPEPAVTPPENVFAAPRARRALPVLVRLPVPWMTSLTTMSPAPPMFSGPLTLMLSLTLPLKVRTWPATVGLKRKVLAAPALAVKPWPMPRPPLLPRTSRVPPARTRRAE